MNTQDFIGKGDDTNHKSTAGPNFRGDPKLKIFVGGIPRTVTDDEYKEYFSTFGDLDDCILMRDQGGVCRGFGFVTYRDQEAFDRVMATQLQIRGTKIEQRKAVPQTDIEKKSDVKVFLGGLSADVDQKKINEFFFQFGEVVNSVVMVDAVTGRSRGFGFVTFSDRESVTELMKNPVFEFCGKEIQCKRAQSAAMMNKIDRSRGRTFGGGWRGSGGAASDKGG